MEQNFIKRSLYQDLKDHLREKEITLLVGPRQVGKTTLLRRLEEESRSQLERTLFLDLDREADRPFFINQEALAQHLRLALGNERGIVFIDEIQRKENAGLFLKGVYDMGLPYKFVVSGSGSLELKEKIHESLAGRKRIFELMPVSFFEFADFRTGYRYGERISDALASDVLRQNTLLDEYLVFGGYPAVILADRADQKRAVLDEIYQSYLMRDVTLTIGVEKMDAFADLVRILASQVGQMVVYSELAVTVGISLPTIKQYLWYIEHTFMARRIRPFVRNARKEVTKSPVYYFHDLGMRNLAARTLGSAADVTDGILFENFVYTLVRDHARRMVGDVRFWRSKDGAEVDFVLDGADGLLPIEVKSGAFREPKVTRSFRSFIERYRPKRGIVATRTFSASMTIGDTEITFVPFYALPNVL